MEWSCFSLSFKLASVTTLLLFLIGLPLSYWLAFAKRPFARFVESLIGLPMVLPPTVLGYYLLLFFHSAGIQGHLLFTFEGLVVGSFFYSLPFAIQPFLNSFGAVEKEMIEVSRSLGAGPLRTFFKITFPLAFPGILSGMILCFMHTLGEFGIVLMIGGNIPGRTRTAALSIFDHLQSLDFQAAHTTALLLISLSFCALFVMNILKRKNQWSRK